MLRAGEERSMAVRTAHVLTPTRRRRRAPPAVCLLALLAVGLTACNRPSQEPPAAGQPNRQARVVAVQTLAPRLRDLTVDSPALGQRVKVRLLLPGRFAAEPARRWPVLWLLHGCGGSTCSCRSATASPARSIRQHPTGRLARSSRPCAHRSSPSPGRSASLPS